MSAVKLYFDPVKTYGPLYCLVWISVAKWWCSQQAFPKSAIFTLNPFYNLGPLSKISFVLKAENSYLTVFFGFLTIIVYFLISETYSFYLSFLTDYYNNFEAFS